jgi:hypothetical protein
MAAPIHKYFLMQAKNLLNKIQKNNNKKPAKIKIKFFGF